ncbi:MAG: cyclic nucleotide-binding domain-containing protein [Abitibacteriaceae bacterium]|nr:cyclic nucleotide-binding domain-containing protein [Abditibacteriaceae bacterium]MBV9868460.1 cyclic nucleotide-binding domain-containing protein [Abditibacteriaceae bacterium]
MASHKITEETPTIEECRRVFSTNSFLAEINDSDIQTLTPLLRARNFVAGTIIFFEEDPADAVYLISSGAVEVFKSDERGKKLPLAILRDSGLLGEIGLLNNVPRTATARTLNATRVLYLTTTDFSHALHNGTVPVYRMVLAFARILAQRLSAADEKLFELFHNNTRDPKFEQLEMIHAGKADPSKINIR